MKRILALTAMLASAAAMSGSTLAATNAYGSVKLQWNVTATLNAAVHTNYLTTGLFGGTTAVEGTGAGTGTCAIDTGQTDLTVDFGNITPSATTWTGCNYENALAVSVQTNDASGFSVKEYLDAAPAGGAVFCAFPNQPATFGSNDTTTGTVAQTTRAGAPPAPYTGAACATGGTQVTQGTGGTLVNSGVAPAQPGTLTTAYTGEYYSAPTNANLTWVNNTAAAGTAVLMGEDLQVNVPTNGASSNPSPSTVNMTLQFVAN